MPIGVNPRKVASEMQTDPSTHEEGGKILDEVKRLLEERRHRERVAICGAIDTFKARLAAAAPEADLHAAKMAIPDTTVTVDIPVNRRFTKNNGGSSRIQHRAWDPTVK